MRQHIAAEGQAPWKVRPAITGVAASVWVLFAAGARAGSASAILDASGVRGGLIVHVGCGDGKLTAALRASRSYLVHGLDTDAARIDEARGAIKAKGLYGPVSIAAFDGHELPYVEGSVNLLVVERGYEVQEREILRVLAPRGVALVGGRKITKPVPDYIDEWSHFLQGPENNPVAQDTVVGPPRRMQWAAGPRWLRSHEVPSGITSMVTAGGRIFYTLDEGPIGITDSRLPEKWALYARDAFNGTLLWKIPVPNWGWQTWRSQLKRDLKGTDWIKTSGLRTSVPGDYAYRMVADGERLYFTLGNKAPVSVIDAATGKVLATCAGSNSPRQLLLSDGVLVAYTSGRILAFNSSTGKPIWKKDVKAASVAAHGRRLVYRAGGNDVRCLDLGSGEQLWKANVSVAGHLMIARGVVLSVSGSSMQTLSLESGKPIWSKGKAGSRRRSRGRHPGVYVVDDTIWTGYRGQRVSLKTGKKLPSLSVKNLWSPQHHHRCYPNKATSRYIIGAMEGLEYLCLKGDGHSRNNWVRGACRLGIMPANGMTYVPFDQCFCSPGVKLLGFTALTAATPFGTLVEKQHERGPAYGTAVGRVADVSGDWPAFRHDSLRSGAVATSVPAEITPGWQRELKGPLTQPVVAGDLLCIASRDTHTVHALDAGTGRERWSFTSGGRVDSPPTIHGGLVLFGSADGHVYCLRKTDGALAWRFRAAPERRLVGSFGQLESVWPVHGSVLMLGGLAYVSAGRSTYLDGGIYLYALEPATGNVVHSHLETGPYEDHTKDHGHSYWSEGARNDVLVTDGESIYIMQLRFSPRLEPRPAKTASLLGDRKMGRRIFSTAGFLDDEWYNRTFWMHSNIWPGFYLANQAPKSGQLLVFDRETTYGVKVFWTRNRHSTMFFPATRGYLLFADDNDNEPILVGRDKRKAIDWLPKFNMSKGGKPKKNWGPSLSSAPRASDVNAYTYNKDKGIGFTRAEPPKWAVWVPVRVKAMVRTAGKLFIAGAPDVFDEKDDPLGALEGRKGGVLRAVSAADGGKLAEYRLDAPPVLDGLVAARGRLFVATRDGHLTCWRGR